MTTMPEQLTLKVGCRTVALAQARSDGLGDLLLASRALAVGVEGAAARRLHRLDEALLRALRNLAQGVGDTTLGSPEGGQRGEEGEGGAGAHVGGCWWRSGDGLEELSDVVRWMSLQLRTMELLQ